MFQKKRFVHFWLTCLKNIKENEVAIVPVSFVFGTALALFSWFCRLPRSSLSAAYHNGLNPFLKKHSYEVFIPFFVLVDQSYKKRNFYYCVLHVLPFLATSSTKTEIEKWDETLLFLFLSVFVLKLKYSGKGHKI